MEKCKILIVDDIPTNVTLISTIIKRNSMPTPIPH